MIRTRRGRRGLTLVELIFAITIMAISIFALFGMVLQTKSVSESQKELTLAKQAAVTKLEELRAQDWNDLTDPTTTLLDPFTVEDLHHASGPNGVAQGTITIQNQRTDTAGDPVLYDLVIEVVWEGIRGETRYSMRGMITR